MNFSPRVRTPLHSSSCAVALAVAAFSAPLSALDSEREPGQTAQNQDNEGTGDVIGDDPLIAGSGATGNEIVVTATRLRGQLDVEQAPLLELDENAIAAEGVTSIGDLITQVSNQTGSARGRGGGGRPIILVNGIRVGSFRELRSYPPEALARVEVFPEEVAQRFGFSPDRRVVNLILKENYSSREIELEFETPDRGGYFVTEQELGFLKIADGARINANFETQDNSLLTEAERNIVQTDGSISDLTTDPDQAAARSLVADNRSIEGNVSYAKAFIESGTSVSANLNYTRNDSRSLSGLDTVTLTDAAGNSLFRTFGADNPLERRSATDTVSASGSLTRLVNAFQLSTTFDASLVENELEIDQNFDSSELIAQALAGSIAIDAELPTSVQRNFDTANTQSINATSLATLRGPLANLPAGEITATFDVGLDWERIESSDTRTVFDTELVRRDFSAGANLVIPLTGRRNGFADALGSFTLTAQAGIDDLSDFGLLGDYNFGLTWAPFDNLDLSANYIYREVAPTLSNLGSPQVLTLNAAVFDFVTGESVLADVVTGGNPLLPAETQRDWKFAANWELPFIDRSRFTVEYIRNRSSDVTSSFPALTSAVEAAFADRVVRDVSGTLVSIDRTPVAFARTRADRINFILSTRGQFGGSSDTGRGQSGRSANAEGRRGGPGRFSGDTSRQPAADRPSRPQRAGGPPSEQQRAAMRQFRQQVCAEDGLSFLMKVVERAESGEDLSSEFPNLDRQRIDRMLSRMRNDDGQIEEARVAQFREFFCSREARGPRPNKGDRQAERPAQSPQDNQAAAGQRRGPGGAGFNPLGGRPGGNSGWRYFATYTHTVELQNEILISPGVPVLDQLDGDSTSAFGLARHSGRLEGGIFGNGVGMRLSAVYTGSATVNGSDLPGSTDIFIGDLATFDIRVFSNIGELVGKNDGFLKGLRVSLRADNIFDARRNVTDEAGVTPINYQPFLIDPTGRYLGIDIRKLF
ncbi:hypothetical protein BPTFM16_01123 [Altererythrobacter insulae]|nr:hypothetical protein BPTFM16_01123 [Altererythrobacter insulae]